MSLDFHSPEKRQKLIGLKVRYLGKDFEIIEIIEERPAALVLREEQLDDVQDDAFGHPYRRVSETLIIPCYNTKGEANPDLLALEVCH